jgi:hypothetical protein
MKKRPIPVIICTDDPRHFVKPVDNLIGDIRNHKTTRSYIGIDNGASGGLAGIFSTGQVWVTPTKVLKLGAKGGRILDIQGNLDWIARFAEVARESYGDAVFVAYEQGQKQPRFGCKGNYSTGASNEFWRVLLTLAKFAHTPVNPKSWQGLILKDIRGDDTKVQAAQVVVQRFPALDLSEYNQEQRGGITDALCIALWAKETWK